MAADLAFPSEGIIMDIKRVIMAITTSSSTRLKPSRSGFCAALKQQVFVSDVLRLTFTL